MSDPLDVLGSATDGRESGGYYGSDFQGFRGVTQVYPLSPTISNVVVDAAVQYWVEVMVYSAVRRGQEVRHQNSLFYADDGMVASSDPRCIQGAFITLEGIFERVGLKTNFGKAV